MSVNTTALVGGRTLPDYVPPGGGDIPIRATLPVGQPTLFAVTVEKPGGVVVSDRSQLALAAPVK